MPLSLPLGRFSLGVIRRYREKLVFVERRPVEIGDLPLTRLEIETGNNEDWIDSLVYLYNDNPDEQMDLRDIHFEMHLRHRPADRELILGLSSLDWSLAIAAPPDVGHLMIYVPQAVMITKTPGNYVGDVVASKAGLSRVCLTVELQIKLGVTRI